MKINSCNGFIFLLSCTLLLVHLNVECNIAPYALGNPYIKPGGYDLGYQSQYMRPSEEISYWDSYAPYKQQANYPPNALQPLTSPQTNCVAEGAQIIPEPDLGLLDNLYQYFITLLRNLLPGPIRFVLGLY